MSGDHTGRTGQRAQSDTVARIPRGDTWPDMATVAHLEHGLGADLWPGRMNPDDGVETDAGLGEGGTSQ